MKDLEKKFIVVSVGSITGYFLGSVIYNKFIEKKIDKAIIDFYRQKTIKQCSISAKKK